MRLIARALYLVVAVSLGVALGVAVPHFASAQVCGDADNNGSLSVSDAVNVLRAAAGLTSLCTVQVCDLNVDGRVTVSDGVIALRQAAGLGAQSSCTQAQVSQVVDTTKMILEAGIGVPSGSDARHAAATELCTGGGTIDVEPGRADFFDCVDGDDRFNGTFFLSNDGNGTLTLSTTQFSLVLISTGDTLFLTGSISATLGDAEFTANGQLAISSPTLGEFTESLNGVVVDSNSNITGGTVDANVQRGLGVYANLSSLQVRFIGPVVIADVSFVSGATASVYIDSTVGAGGVCTPCESDSDCAAGLGCFDCDDQGPKPCTGDVARCTVDVQDVILECQDGYF